MSKTVPQSLPINWPCYTPFSMNRVAQLFYLASRGLDAANARRQMQMGILLVLNVLWREEIVHQLILFTMKHCKYWDYDGRKVDKPCTNWCRISSIHREWRNGMIVGS